MVIDLVAGFSAFAETFELLGAEWGPEAPPVTVTMSELGRALVEHAGRSLSPGDIAEIFRRIEHIFECGTEAEKDAAATGFLEAIAGSIDRSPERRWVLDHAGQGAREYLAAWDRFCGRSPPLSG